MQEAVLLGTPGYYCAFAYWMGAVLFIMVSPMRPGRLRSAGIMGIFGIGIVGFSILTDTNLPIYFLPCLFAVLALTFLMIYLCIRGSLLNVGYLCVRAFVLGEFSASLEWQCYYYEMTIFDEKYSLLCNILTLIVVHGAVFICMYLLERKYRDYNYRLRIEKKEFLQALFIAVGIYLVSNISNVSQNTPFSSSFPAEIMLIRTLVDFGGVMMLYAYHMQLRELGDRMEIEMLKQMMEAQYANYQVSEQSVALVHQKYHDLKHQIAFLREEITSKEKLEYLDQMEEDIRTFEAQADTGNRILDTILTAKRLQCMNQGITMTCVADGTCLEFMEPMDIMALFGNALDNAIESAIQVKDKGRRLIHITVARKKDFFVIEVGNAFEGEITFRKGLPQTTKGDERYHGYGTRSIRATVERYGGYVSFLAKDQWFEMKAMIPVSLNKQRKCKNDN